MIYDFEVVRVQGDIMIYVRIQNEWTGNISGSLKKIFTDDSGKKYFHADRNVYYCDEAVTRFLRKEDFRDRAIEFYKRNGGF